MSGKVATLCASHPAPAKSSDVPPPTPESSPSRARAPIAEALCFIARDSRAQPQDYLDESTTPFGGE